MRNGVTTRCRTCGGDVPQYAGIHPRYHIKTCDDCKAAARDRFEAAHKVRGKLPWGLRQRLLAEKPPQCPTCGAAWDADFHPPELDHVVPISLGGTHDESNLRVICRPCNRRKHNRLGVLS